MGTSEGEGAGDGDWHQGPAAGQVMGTGLRPQQREGQTGKRNTVEGLND